MATFHKIKKGGGKMPRKLKKRIKKIPVGDYCYGSFIGSKKQMENGKQYYKGGFCPYYHIVSGATEDKDAIAYCAFEHELDDFLLADAVKICGDYEQFFPEFKQTEEKKAKHKEDMEILAAKPKEMGAIQYLITLEFQKERKEKAAKAMLREQRKAKWDKWKAERKARREMRK